MYRTEYCVALWLAEKKVHASLVQASERARAQPCPDHRGQQKAGVKAAAKADISGLSDSLLLCAPRLRTAVMTGPGCRSKNTCCCGTHPTPSPASPPHPVPGRLTAPAAGSSTPPASNQQPRCSAAGVFLLEPSLPAATMCEVQIWATLRRPVRKSWPTAQWKTSRAPGIWEHEVVNQPGARSEESKHTLHSLPSAQSARGSSSFSSSSLYCD